MTLSGRATPLEQAMRTFLPIVSGLALLATVVPPALFLAGVLDLASMKRWMALATLVWFLATPAWMGRTTS